MHRLNIFLEHIYEAAQQRGTTFESMLSEALTLVSQIFYFTKFLK